MGLRAQGQSSFNLGLSRQWAPDSERYDSAGIGWGLGADFRRNNYFFWTLWGEMSVHDVHARPQNPSGRALTVKIQSVAGPSYFVWRGKVGAQLGLGPSAFFLRDSTKTGANRRIPALGLGVVPALVWRPYYVSPESYNSFCFSLKFDWMRLFYKQDEFSSNLMSLGLLAGVDF